MGENVPKNGGHIECWLFAGHKISEKQNRYIGFVERHTR